ncbi:probable serine/threonine-protein kinase kinX isoform X3 [Carassius auratus]|uniref:Probable serine/threonine-protein kinase kinX isoform X3 n=1 Tax=Carassius auratus TaxID=7957 RepID=A0A6P6MQP4_CARAU|nr:probable serine/threonine-protein kinase kinX isoform X3 [Carassius auratus]
MDREKDSKTERKGGPSGDILPDNARKEDDEDTGTPSCQPRDPVQKETDPGAESIHDRKEESVRSGEAEKKQTESLLNIPKTEDEEEEEEEEMASDKHEEEVKRDENVQPQITVPVNNKDTGKPSFQPPDPVQKETDPGSVSRYDRKEESVRSGEAEKKQTESLLNIPKTEDEEEEEEEEIASDKHEEELKRDENVQPQITVPVNNKDTGKPSFQPPDPVQKETDPGSVSRHDRKEESVRSGEAEKKQTESLLNIPKTEDEEKEEEEEEMASDKHEEEVKRDENVQPQITVPVNNKDTGKPSFQPPDPVQNETDPGSVSRHDRKEESVRSGEAEKKQTEKTTEKQHHSGTEPKIDREGEICRKPEKSEDLSGDSLSVNEPKEDGPSGDILPDDAQSLLNIPKTEDEEEEEEEEMASDKHEEELKRDENVQPQITVPVNNKDTGKPSFQPPDPVQKETDPGSVSRYDRKEESVRSGEAEKKQTESLLNIPKTEDEEEEEEEEMASDKHEEEVKRDDNVQPQITVPVNNKDTGKPSFQPPDPVQKETDPGSVSRYDRKEESVRSGEAEKKQTEKTTEKQHHSGTEPKIDREGEICRKPEKSEDLSGDSLSVNEPKEDGPSGDILPDNARKEDDEDTGKPSFQPPDPVQKETDPGSVSRHDRKEESVRSGEAEKKQTEKTTEKQHHSGTEPKIDREGEICRKPEKSEDLSGDSLSVNEPKEDGPSGDILPDDAQSLLNIPKTEDEEKEEEEEMASDKHEEEVKRDENVQPQITVPVNNKDTGKPSFQPPDPVQKETDPGSVSRHDRKEESVRSGEAEKKQTEKTTEKQHHSGTEPKIDREGEICRKPEKSEDLSGDSLSVNEPKEDGPSGDILPDNAQSLLNIPRTEDEEKEEGGEMASNKHEEEVKRDENVQPQITVPVNNKTIWTTAVVILIAVVCALCQRSPDSTSSKTKEVNVVDLFNQEMKKLETTFPNQHPELWRRSLIHLRRHLKMKNPTEPVSLILTSDRRAEKTLGCLALGLARAFSTAHNSSVLKINGKNKASQDSDQVKLDIDSELRKAFEGKKSAAVIHHFEELPPGSTLIFYRYCDHENAAYKDVFLAFTVMLDAEVELPSSVSLGRVEEMVQEHIKNKFVSSDKSAMFNQMDVDKLGGLWSRISHLILPVAAEKKFEEQGCGDWDNSTNSF